MDQFISTYQKDYTWPSTRIKHTPPSLLKEGGSCRCSARSREIKVVDLCGDEHEWSRLGPMGRLLDPKLYPAKTGPYPETEASKHDQPSTYIRKLEEKYPNLYGILQSTPIDEIIQRVDRDRLKTTYQVDFSDTAAAAMDKVTRGPCAASRRPPEDIDCRPSTRSGVIKRDRGVSRTGDIGDITKKKGEDDSQETRLPPWRSEYQDSISRLGHAIMKTRIHHKKTAAPAWAMMPPKAGDNRRKASSHTGAVPGNNWSREIHPNAVRYANSNHYPQDCTGEHETKFLDAKTSRETVAEAEETGVNKNNFHNYPDESVFVNVVPKHSNNAALREKYHRFVDHPELIGPEAVIAVQKLQRLKELQMKREFSERYYSQEIKRLIGEYYFGPRLAAPTTRPNGRLQSSSFQSCSGDRQRGVPKNLEPCGTMTTITRLNCGCIQETTRPIFTTARGRVLRRNCSQSQDNMFRFAPSNLQEHLFSSLESQKERQRSKSRKRLPLDPRICHKHISPSGDQDFETENEKRNEEQESEIPSRVSRNTAPYQKCSDTSATSI